MMCGRMFKASVQFFRLLLAVFLAAAVQGARFDLKADLRFPRSRDAHPDSDPAFLASPEAHRRWIRNADFDEHSDENMEVRHLDIADIANERTSLRGDGFERVSLNERLLPLLRRIEAEGLSGRARVGPTHGGATADSNSVEEELALELTGLSAFEMSGGAVSLNLVCSGFVLRRGGPLGQTVRGSGFDQVAHRVHIDQDLEGEPLRRLGMAWALKHVPFLELVNLWSPLTTPRLHPLALMKLSTLEPNDLLRYQANSTKNAGGRHGSFTSDRKMVLFREDQSWCWDSGMKFGHAMIFLTGRTAHSSFSVEPGEKELAGVLAHLLAYQDGNLTLRAACDAIATSARHILSIVARGSSHERIPPSTAELLAEVGFGVTNVCGGENFQDAGMHVARIVRAMERSSLEIRCVSFVLNGDEVWWLVHLAGVSLALICSFAGFATTRLVQRWLANGARRRLRARRQLLNKAKKLD